MKRHKWDAMNPDHVEACPPNESVKRNASKEGLSYSAVGDDAKRSSKTMMKSGPKESRRSKGSTKKNVSSVEDGLGYELVGSDGKVIFNGVKGTHQPQTYKDCLGTIFFLFHVAVVVFVALLALFVDDIPYVSSKFYGRSIGLYQSIALTSLSFTELQAAYGRLAVFAIFCAAFSGIVSLIAFTFMASHKRWVKSSMSISLNIFLGTAISAAIMQQNEESYMACITATVLFFVCTPYIAYNWKRIPVSIV